MNNHRAPAGVLWFSDCCRDHLPLIGGKNASLGELTKSGIRVPPGFAVTTEVYRRFLANADVEESIWKVLSGLQLGDLASEESASRKIRNLLHSAPLPSPFWYDMLLAYERLSRDCGVPNVPVAVRSSATAEDLPGASFAGLQDTYLWVRGPAAVLEAIVKCWSSLFTQRAISYRIQMGFSHDKVLMSVGIQKMVNARAAGVAFTLNPATGDRSKIAIEGNWGLGESVAQGEITPDEFLVDKVTLEISRRSISTKTIEYVVPPGSDQVQVRQVPEDRRNAPCVSEAEVLEIARLAKRIEKYYGTPQDIEWAVDADLPFPENVVILQSRQETAWSQRKAEPILRPDASVLDHIVANLIVGRRLGPARRQSDKHDGKSDSII